MKDTTYLVVGHLTLDVRNGGYTLGGTATYSAVTAARLGTQVRVLTAADETARNLLSNTVAADVVCLPSVDATTFRNSYIDGHRKQEIIAVAASISAEQVPSHWLNSDILHLGPVARETDASIASLFPKATKVVTPQGWLRTWDSNGLVSPTAWKPEPAWLADISVLILSEEDVAGDAGIIAEYARYCPTIIVTQGWRGCKLIRGQSEQQFPARPAKEVDPTGAGDVFATAFAIRLHETGDPVEAAQFANAAGSLSVEGIGISTIPSRETVNAWIKAH